MIKKVIITLSASALVITNAYCGTKKPAHKQDFTPQQVQSIQKIIKSYLVENPRVLLEASMALRKKMNEEQQYKAMRAIKKNWVRLFNNPQTPVLGNPKGNVIIAEFFDYQCPHCKENRAAMDTLIKNNKSLKIMSMEWPIFGGASLTAAKAALAAKKQGKYAELHNALLAAPNPLTEEKIMAIAKKNGLNIKKLRKDMDAQEVMLQIKTNFHLAHNLGLMGTPAFVITKADTQATAFIPGAANAEQLQQKINSLK